MAEKKAKKKKIIQTCSFRLLCSTYEKCNRLNSFFISGFEIQMIEIQKVLVHGKYHEIFGKYAINQQKKKNKINKNHKSFVNSSANDILNGI